VSRLFWERAAFARLMDLQDEDPPLAARLQDAIEQYADGRRGQVRRLSGRDEWRLRVGDWRIIFVTEAGGETIVVTAIDNRRDAYR
jgi:mRNA-degrading endonuclease RelE of RelBE toxin-antitoxin system